MTAHNIICVHTMVGYLVSTDNYFRLSNGTAFSGTESHFGVGGKWGPDLGGHLDGAVWQWQDLTHRADANLDGNGEVISIETADNAARPIQPWTPLQLNSLVDLIAWLCRRYSIPPTLIPDTRPGRRGLGYHAQGACERTAGGVRWSTSPGKDCPTAPRIHQFKTVVIPRVQAKLRGDDPDPIPVPAPRKDDSEMLVLRRTDGMAYLMTPDGVRPVSGEQLDALTKAGVPEHTALTAANIASIREVLPVTTGADG